MAVKDPSAAPGENAGAAGEDASLREESRAAAQAAAAHIGKLAATAGAEARLSAASIVAVIAAGLLAVFLLVAGWLFLLASGVWIAVETGMSMFAALLVAAAINILGVALFLFWCSRLIKNIGFSRTFRLIRPEPR